MYADDHPPPHFHAAYSGKDAAVNISSSEILIGSLPPRAWRLVQEWLELHRIELEENWRRMEAELPLLPIDPL